MIKFFLGIFVGCTCAYFTSGYLNISGVMGSEYGLNFIRSHPSKGVSIAESIRLLDKINKRDYDELKTLLESMLITDMFIAASRCEVLSEAEQELLRDGIYYGNLYFLKHPMSETAREQIMHFNSSDILKKEYSLFEGK